jgi:hypothetical protein
MECWRVPGFLTHHSNYAVLKFDAWAQRQTLSEPFESAQGERISGYFQGYATVRGELSRTMNGVFHTSVTKLQSVIVAASCLR